MCLALLSKAPYVTHSWLMFREIRGHHFNECDYILHACCNACIMYVSVFRIEDTQQTSSITVVRECNTFKLAVACQVAPVPVSNEVHSEQRHQTRRHVCNFTHQNQQRKTVVSHFTSWHIFHILLRLTQIPLNRPQQRMSRTTLLSLDFTARG